MIALLLPNKDNVNVFLAYMATEMLNIFLLLSYNTNAIPPYLPPKAPMIMLFLHITNTNATSYLPMLLLLPTTNAIPTYH